MFDTSEGITQVYQPEHSPDDIRNSIEENNGSNKRGHRRGRTGSQELDRRSSIDVSLSRIRRRPEDFYGGLNAEVTAIEMEDLSSAGAGGRLHFHR